MVSAVVGEEEEGGDGCLPDHAGDAVRLLFLGTVEPNGCRVGCQHDRLRGPRRFGNSKILERGRSGLLTLGVGDVQGELAGVGSVTRDVAGGETARGGLTRLREQRLGDSVVRAGNVEDKGNGVADVCGYRVGVELEGVRAIATDNNLPEEVR